MLGLHTDTAREKRQRRQNDGRRFNISPKYPGNRWTNFEFRRNPAGAIRVMSPERGGGVGNPKGVQMTRKPKDTPGDDNSGKSGHDSADGRPSRNGEMKKTEDKGDDRLNEDISAFYDDLANEPMPARLRELLKTLGDENGKK